MTHVCAFKPKEVQYSSDEANLVPRWKKRFQQYIIISSDNLLSHYYLKSEVSILKEQRRQLSANCCVIHPFSKFRKWYEIYLIYLYTSVLITKPLDSGFMSGVRYEYNPFYTYYTIFTDMLSWVDIFLNFFTGFVIKKSKTVELRHSKIIIKYVCGPYFICDALSSIPKALLYHPIVRKVYLPPTIHKYVYLVVNMFSLCKIIRIGSLLGCLDRAAQAAKSKYKGILFLLYTFILLVIVGHWLACLQFTDTIMIRWYMFTDRRNETWIERAGLTNKSIIQQYTHSFFKSAAYILGVRISRIYRERLPEELILATVTYVIGKVLVIFVWIVLAVAILNSRSIEIKFADIINQLDEYMKQKQLPLNLKEKILQYYHFKYQNKFLNERLITGMFSTNLQNEVNRHLCRSLITNVSLFADLSPSEVSKLVQYLIPEIFLPNETIIQAGTYGDTMYFLSSGTVAVYTHSGKEICHLQDGAYFGEISLILKGQTRTATIVAIETSQVYRLNRKDFERCLLRNKNVLQKMLKHAERRLKETTKIEEEYKKMLFAQSYQRSSTGSKKYML